MNPTNIENAIKWLEQTHLVGALDLGKALNEAVTTATTTRITKLESDNVRVPTLLYNGYAEFVADLYTGMENEALFM